jgi:methenyltetrahydromethanopterin cyclohydrolase
MSKLENLIEGHKIGGTKEFPIYQLKDFEGGKIFAESSMGFLGKVDYSAYGREIIVKTTISKPVLATLGMQLAGWAFGDAMISGPVRLMAKKPGFIFNKLRFEELEVPPIACIEGNFETEELLKELKGNEFPEAKILWIQENSMPQFVNIPSRACECVIYQMFNLFDLNETQIEKASSICKAKSDVVGSISSNLNDSLRYNTEVILEGNFGEGKDFSKLVTKNTKYADKSFLEILKSAGGIHKVDLEAFSVARLTIIDTKKHKTRVIR